MEWILMALGAWTALKVGSLWSAWAQQDRGHPGDRRDPPFGAWQDSGSHDLDDSWWPASGLHSTWAAPIIDINPATGLHMLDGMGSADAGGNLFGMSNSTDDFSSLQDGSCGDINPASGLPMVDGSCGVDVAGNPYGFDLNDHSHGGIDSSSVEDSWSSSSSFDDSWSSSSSCADSFSSCSSGMDWD